MDTNRSMNATANRHQPLYERHHQCIITILNVHHPQCTPPPIHTTPNLHYQVDLSISPLVDPLAPKKGVAPHGIIGQSWNGDGTTIVGARDNLGQLRQEQGKEVTTRAQAKGPYYCEDRTEMTIVWK